MYFKKCFWISAELGMWEHRVNISEEAKIIEFMLISAEDLNMKKIKKNIKILSPKIYEDLLTSVSFEGFLEDEDQLCMKLISDCIIEDQSAEKVNFKQVIFRDVSFKNVALSRADIEDVRFENCDLSNVDLSGALMHRVEFIDCKVLGSNLSEASLQNVVFNKCNARYVNLVFSRCKRFRIEESELSLADFRWSEFTDANFVNTKLQESQLAGTKLDGVDLSTCDIDGIVVTPEDIRGAIVSSLQAVALSRLLGLVIKEDFVE
jgi:uncharacterized protein YjbI with pentapeptide repeats